MMRASSLPPLSRFLFFAIALVALAVLVVGDGAPPAQAQTATVLVSNFGQTPAISNFDLTTTSVVRAQGFATGSDSGGYTLGSIEANIRNAPTAEAQRDTIRAELWSATTAGAPDSIVASLTVPDHPITAGTVKFTAPASTSLTASTTYFLLIYTTGNFNLGVTTAVGAAEDSGGAAGWTINDKYHFASSGSDRNVPSGVTGWNQPAGSPFPIRLRVNSEAADPTDLSALTAESSTDNNTFDALALSPEFAPATTAYTATVDNHVTHVRLTPTLADASSSVKVGKGSTLTTVANGSASGSIALDVGGNQITVEVTDSDGATKNYTVTVTRRFPYADLANTVTIWSATLTANDIIGSGAYGCDDGLQGVLDAAVCAPSGALTDDTFAYEGVDYEIGALDVSSGGLLRFVLDSAIPQDLVDKVTLVADGYGVPLSAGAVSSSLLRELLIENTGLSWSAGDTVHLRLVRPSGAPGDLDLTFSAASTLTTAIGSAGDRGHAMAVQPDGKTVVAGYSHNGTDNDFALLRYNADGSLDTSFGTGGKVVTPIGAGDDRAYAVAVHSDGKIVAAGLTGGQFALARYTSTGALDTSFDTDGKVTTTVGSGSGEIAYAVAFQSNGKIVAAGKAPVSGAENFTVVRYNVNGSLDTSFDSDGKVSTDFASANDRAQALAIQPDGKIVVAGFSNIGGENHFALVRYNTNGSLDTGFHTDGKADTDIGTGGDAKAVAIQPDGKIVLAGISTIGTSLDFVLARYTSTGDLDDTFGEDGADADDKPDGYVTTAIGSGDDNARAVAIQPDGRIVVAGDDGSDFALARYTSVGKLDTGFGDGGKATTHIGSIDEAYAVAVRPDGHILAAGYSFDGTSDDIALAAYTPRGDPAAVLDGPGYVTTAIGAGRDTANGMAIQADGKIVAVGSSDNGSDEDFAVTRYNADGTPDTGFGTGGKVTADYLNEDEAYAVAIQSDGKIVAAGAGDNGSDNDFALLRLNADGSADTGFGPDADGWAYTDGILSAEEEVARAVAIQSDGKIVAAGYAENATDDDFAVARYTTNGLLDTSFGEDGPDSNDDPDGYVTTAIGSGDDRAYAMAIQSDNKIVVVGYSSNAGNNDFALARYNANGTLDTSFGTGGKVTTAIGSSHERAYAVAIQSDNKIVVAGYSNNGTNTDFALVRYTSAGALDTGFGTGGKVTTAIGSGDERAYGMAIQSDGKIVAAGYSNNGSTDEFALVRYDDDGSLDTGFGVGGKVTSAIGTTSDLAFAMALQSEGRIVVAGRSDNGGAIQNDDFALARYHAAETDPTPAFLVSNAGQTASNVSFETGNISVAQAFTTGAASGGSTLDSIDAVISNTGITEAQRDAIRAELWSAGTGGAPGSKLADLTVPAHPISSGTVSFAAPASTTLAASTTYYAVFYTVGSFGMTMGLTTSDSEDAGIVAGWSIADGARLVQVDVPVSSTTWLAQQTEALLITVKGSEAQTTSLDLSALTAESTTDSNTWSALALSPAFAAATTGYRATVGNDVTHVRLTPTLADPNSSVQVGKSSGTLAAVNSGSASTAIALDVGDNAITVRVTATDATTQDYTVTVHRVPSGSVWYATFTPGASTNAVGCEDKQECDSALTGNTFTVGGDDFYFGFIVDNASNAVTSPNALEISFVDNTGLEISRPNDALKALNFCVGSGEYALTTPASINSYTWANANLPWAEGVPVSLSIGTACAQAQTVSLDLSSLTAESTPDSNTWTALDLSPAFAAATADYRATVGNDVTHVRLTPTLADTNSSVQVGRSSGTLAAVNSGSASTAIALDVGDNAITVRVTDTDSSTQDYTVTVQRAPADTLVSNTGQISSEDAYFSTDSALIAQGFTTGSADGGYTLTSIEAFLVDDASAAESGKFRAQLWSAVAAGANAGAPSAKVADLTVPSDMPQGIVSFAAPSNTALAASTIYHLVLYTIDNTDLAVDLTEMEGEDAGGQAGWAIENKSYGQEMDEPDTGQPWAVYGPNNGLLKLRVRGAAAQQDAFLVSNAGQTDTGSAYSTGAFSAAQAFTTGAVSGGYTLGSIDVVISNTTSITEAQRDTIRAELWSANTDGSPNAKSYDLTVPAHPISSGTVSFAAPANTTLSASTTYYAVFYTVGAFSMDLGNTTSDSEDTGSAAGWSIANGARSVQVDVPTSSTTWLAQGTDSLRITVREGQAQPRSTNANLSALRAESSPDGVNFTALALSPAFAAATTAYTATVPHSSPYVDLIPTVEETGKATMVLTPPGISQPDGVAAVSTLVEVGETVITIRVTAEDGVTTKDYTVTITREAQRDAFLVSNAGQTAATANWITDVWSVAQAFTTGAFSGGYTLESIDAVINATSITQAQRDSIRAELWSSATGGAPGQKIVDLTVPAHPIATGTVSFTAPASTNLAASTTYYAVFYTVGAFDMKLGRTASSSEDAGSAVGWSIADSIRNVQDDAPTSSSSWTSRLSPVRITVNGSEGQMGTPTVTASLTVMPNPVPEGGPVTVTVSLSQPLTSDVTIPLVITDDTAEATDHGALASIAIAANAFSGTGTITTARDDDGEDETFTVALGSLPESVQADANRNSVTVTISDEEGALLLACPEEGRIWLADMTAGRNTLTGGTVATGYGVGGSSGGTITVGGFMYRHTYYRVDQVSFNTNSSDPDLNNKLVISLDRGWTDEMVGRLALSVDGTLYHLAESTRPQHPQTRVWSAPLDWEEGRRVRLCLSESLVSLSVERYRVPEGEDVVVKATLSRPLSSDAAFPTVISGESRGLGSAPTITIPAGQTEGRGTITTSHDDNSDDERFRVSLGRDALPSSVRLGRPDSAPVTIVDDEWETPVTVSLSASPNPVREGSGVTVTATLRIGEDPAVLSYDVYVPLRVDRGTSEEGDHGTLAGITIPAGERSAAGTIWTLRDGDGDDETFSVSLGGLPRGSPRAGCPATVRVTISERAVSPDPDGGNPEDGCPAEGASGSTGGSGSGSGQQSAPPPQDPTAVTLALGEGTAQELTVGEDAGDVTIAATLDAPAPDGGVSLDLRSGIDPDTAIDDTAARDADYTMPETIVIPAGERSGRAVLTILDDAVDEEDETANIVAVAALFDGPIAGSAALTITDDDTAGVTITAAAPLAVDEGNTATYTVVLDSQPTSDVTVTPASDDPGAATVSPASHVFTPSGWNTAATFTVSGVADTDTNDESVGISHSVASDDALYGAVIVSTVSVTVSDTTTTGQENQERSPQEKYADLIAKIKEWRNDPCCASNKAHTDRWDRTLLAFGVTVEDTTLEPMTAAEAQTYADRGWTRWVETATALRELENQAPTVGNAIADATIVKEDGTKTVSLTGVFSDADNDSLTITASSSDDAVATVSVASDYSTLTVTAKSRGTATVTVTAADGKGGTVEDAFTVTVKAAPVVDSAIGDVSGLEVGATRDVSLSGVFRDADGDSLTITAASSGEAIATATVAADQSKLTVAGVAEGTATITVTAQDADGNTVSDTFDVAVVKAPEPEEPATPNQAPTVADAIADVTIVNESGTRQVSLAGVFSDGDNDGLTITAKTSAETVATVSVASDHSSLTVSAKARGTATITVTAKDGKGGTVSDAFTVKVKAAPTVSSAIADLSLEVGGTQDITLSSVFTDADGDDLTFAATSSDPDVANPVEFHGTLTIIGGSAGSATVTVTAQDADGNTVSDAFDVSVGADQQQQQQDPPPNQAPTVASAISDATIVNQSGTRQVSLSGVFDDADGDSLTITAATSEETKATVSVASDYSSLTVTAQARGTATITVTAKDGKGGTVDDTFTVTVKAAPVVASPISDVSGLEVGATRDVSLSGVFRDADGDSLTITAASSDDAIATASVASDGSTLTLTGVAEGTATITVTARDTDGNAVGDTFDVSVVKAEDEGPPVVANLRCRVDTGQVLFRWDAPEWSGGETYAYDFHLTLPGGGSESGRVIGGSVLYRTGEYPAGSEASVSVKAVYQLPDGSQVSSAEETLTCTVEE